MEFNTGVTEWDLGEPCDTPGADAGGLIRSWKLPPWDSPIRRSSSPSFPTTMSTTDPANALPLSDEGLLAELGYKQEFKRAFSPLQVSTINYLRTHTLELIISRTRSLE
jgi:hypothetical protein